MQSVQALGPTVVAVIAALFALYIGRRQWKTAHDRLSFDLFEKRFARALRRTLGIMPGAWTQSPLAVQL